MLRPLVLVLIIISFAIPAVHAEPTYDELQQQLKALQSRVATLEARDTASAEEQRRTVEQIVADAEKRSRLLVTADGNLTAGYDKGFFIRSEDGDFSLRPSVLFQFRDITNIRSGADEGIENGFEFRRVRPRATTSSSSTTPGRTRTTSSPPA